MSTFSKCESSAYPIRTLFVDSPEPGDGLLAKSLLWPDRERHKRTTFAIAVCAELFVLAAITGHSPIAMILGSGCAWGLWWQYRRETSMASEGDRSSRGRRWPAGMLLLLGITITVWTWYLWPVRRHLPPGAGNRSHARNRTSASQRDLSWRALSYGRLSHGRQTYRRRLIPICRDIGGTDVQAVDYSVFRGVLVFQSTGRSARRPSSCGP